MSAVPETYAACGRPVVGSAIPRPYVTYATSPPYPAAATAPASTHSHGRSRSVVRVIMRP
jgi:hypothetical protein